MSKSTVHILVGIDFSDSSMAALNHAIDFGSRMQARLHLCHFVKSTGVEAQSDLGLNVPDEFPEAKQARIQLQRSLSNLGSDIDAQIHVRIGDPVRGMLALAKLQRKFRLLESPYRTPQDLTAALRGRPLLQPQQIDDLVAWLQTLQNPP